VLQASCEGISASVSINVEQAAPAPKRARPPLAKPRKPEPAAEERRPIRRRRGSRSRSRHLLAASVGVLLLAPVLWLYGGLRDAVLNRSKQSATVEGVDREAFQVTPTEPVAAILRGAPASVTIERGPRGPLLPGASTKLLAEVRDRAGRTVSVASVSWSSTNPRVARVDSASGWLHAVRPGRARAVAASGELRASVPIVVRRPTVEQPAPASVSISPQRTLREADSQLAIGPADLTSDTHAIQAYEPEPAPPEEPEETAPLLDPPAGTREDPDAERRRLDAAILAGVQQCYDALRSKNVTRVAELYRPATASDEDKLNKLTRILRTEEWAAVVGERVDGARRLGPESVAMDFGFQLVWKDAFGGRLRSRPVFRAEFAKSGSEWEISSCRIMGSPKL
jgi:hypothetical protein